MKRGVTPFDIVVLLLNANANPNHQTDKGVTPLVLACLASHLRIVELLLTNGADPDIQDSNNSNALAFAHHSGCWESSKLLLTFSTDSSPQIPDLDMMVSNLDSLQVNFLLSSIVDLDMKDKGT